MLAQAASVNTKSSQEQTLADIYFEFEQILKNSSAYEVKSNIDPLLPKEEQLAVFNQFAHIKIDSCFTRNFLLRFTNYITNEPRLAEMEKELILSSCRNSSPILNIKNSENISNSTLIQIFNNVYASSDDYWSKLNDKNMNPKSSNTVMIWSDAGGALVGLMCGGVMSVLMAATVSHSVDKAIELGNQMEQGTAPPTP